MTPRLFLLTLCVLFPVATHADNTSAQQQSRMDQLQARIVQLESRMAQLEQRATPNPSTPPVVIALPPAKWHVCRLQVFNHEYEAGSDLPGEARHRVQQDCRRKESAIFCSIEKIACEAH